MSDDRFRMTMEDSATGELLVDAILYEEITAQRVARARDRRALVVRVFREKAETEEM